MIKVDLITGFLGSGKTTFIKQYVGHLTELGQKIGIIENDFGAINVDMLLLQDLQNDRCEVEQIVGGSVISEWKRRFRTKLISMAMRGFDRIIVEPSGIYDVDVFFDVMYDETVENWYEIGNVFTIMDANLATDMSDAEQYLVTSQVANSGQIILSKLTAESDTASSAVLDFLNMIMDKYHCDRHFSDKDILAKNWVDFNNEDYNKLLNCGWKRADHQKMWIEQNKSFDSLFFMNMKFTKQQLLDGVSRIMNDQTCGSVHRIKGFAQIEDETWLQINITQKQTLIEPIKLGQEVIIIIGENLNEPRIRELMGQGDV